MVETAPHPAGVADEGSLVGRGQASMQKGPMPNVCEGREGRVLRAVGKGGKGGMGDVTFLHTSNCVLLPFVMNSIAFTPSKRFVESCELGCVRTSSHEMAYFEVPRMLLWTRKPPSTTDSPPPFN